MSNPETLDGSKNDVLCVDKHVSVLVVGAGPTGLGAATRLHQLGHEDWLLVDSSETAGGLACTDVTKEGFLFDLGGHVIFSHFEFFDELLQDTVGKFDDESAWVSHQRVSYVHYKGTWVPYPFQLNLCFLPVEDQILAINGLVKARVRAASFANDLPSTPANFDEWMEAVMGEGITNMFMRPYNTKVWTVPPEQMQWQWLADRVAVVDTERAISNVLRKQEDSAWGPNVTFKFPKHGGTGAIWKAVHAKLPSDYTKLGHTLVSINVETKVAVFLIQSINQPREERQTVEKDETEPRYYRIKYDSMINTIPLDSTLQLLEGITNEESQRCNMWANDLSYSSTHIIGLGLRGLNPHGPKCWLYFPDPDIPFYRATVFSHYSTNNTPAQATMLHTVCVAKDATAECVNAHCELGTVLPNTHKPGPYWSLMLEVSEGVERPVSIKPEMLAETVQACIRTGLLAPDNEIVSLYHRRLEHGYPIPTLKRDTVLDATLPWLRTRAGVWSRGRFGCYKYEVGNQDHSVAIGVEAVDNILSRGSSEKEIVLECTLDTPAQVNRRGVLNEFPKYLSNGTRER